jgi:hypothetical protein
MKKLGLIIGEQKNPKRPKNLHTEFQQYGVYLAETLEDTTHYSLYIKLAKNYPRAMLEDALSFVKGSTTARSKGKLFMWKVKQLKDSATPTE